jgi:fumarylacetoacetase
VTSRVDETIGPGLRSWVDSAQAIDTDFPIQNLPLGCFRADNGLARPGIAIGRKILDVAASSALGLLAAEIRPLIETCIAEGSLNALLAAGNPALTTLRGAASRLLRDDTPEGADARKRADHVLVDADRVSLVLPVRIGDYSDFYASIDHASNVGSMFRPDNALLPNYKWVPIGYHGRASSIVPSGTTVSRPSGQTRDDAGAPPVFGPSRRLDYELEVGAIIGKPNRLGEPIAMSDADSHLAGLCLVNDWSARDIQTWEYQPLGPFLAKSFATTISPWIVTLDALMPFRVAVPPRAEGDPLPLPYLTDAEDARRGAFDIQLEVSISTRRMRDEGLAPHRISHGNFTSMYWTVGQLITHHASNGCNLRPGDMLASGTVSGPAKESRGCLLERTWRGTEPLALPSGESRRFLEDGDEVIMRGWCERAGYRRIGFGECRGTVSES